MFCIYYYVFDGGLELLNPGVFDIDSPAMLLHGISQATETIKHEISNMK